MSNSSWQDRLESFLGSGRYDETHMRRSLQSVVLFEAMRCIKPRLDNLRPFQRRWLLLEQVYEILDSLTFLSDLQKEQVLWRTQTKGEQLNDEVAWTRAKGNEKYLNKTVEQLRPFVVPGRSHQEAVNAMVQQAYVSCRFRSSFASCSYVEFGGLRKVFCFAFGC
jgi:hypothetical protein